MADGVDEILEEAHGCLLPLEQASSLPPAAFNDGEWYDAERTTLATNPMLVERVADLARTIGRRPATPTEARAILGLEP